MNADVLKGKWTSLKGEVKAQWGKLTDDEIIRTEGDLDKLRGKLQEKYGYSKEKAHDELNQFLNRVN